MNGDLRQSPVPAGNRGENKTGTPASGSASYRAMYDGVVRLLNDCHSALLAGDTATGMKSLIDGLRSLRVAGTEDEWRRLSRRALEHPIVEILHEDPLTLRAFVRPNGYVQDATFLDYIYTEGVAAAMDASVTPRGRAIHEAVVSLPIADAIRERRSAIALIVDDVAGAIGSPRILMLGGSALAELETAISVRSGAICEMVLVDDDEAALERAVTAHAAWPVKAIRAGVKEFSRDTLVDGKFDAIFVPAVLDRLESDQAAEVSARLFALLRPNGLCFLANVMRDVSEAGYMEVFMRWQPRYRSPYELLELMRPFGSRAATRLSADSHRAIAFASIRRLVS